MGSCSPDIDAANAMAPLIMVLMILFGGFYIHCYVISDSLKIVVIYIESICIIIKYIHSLSLSLSVSKSLLLIIPNLKCSKLEEVQCFKTMNCEWTKYDETTLEKIDEELDELEGNGPLFLMEIAPSHSIESEVVWNEMSRMSLFAILVAAVMMMALYQCWTMREAKDGYIELSD